MRRSGVLPVGRKASCMWGTGRAGAATNGNGHARPRVRRRASSVEVRRSGDADDVSGGRSVIDETGGGGVGGCAQGSEARGTSGLAGLPTVTCSQPSEPRLPRGPAAGDPGLCAQRRLTLHSPHLNNGPFRRPLLQSGS
eukprot:349964-Chlamydomonas_euryale.AAC.3